MLDKSLLPLLRDFFDNVPIFDRRNHKKTINFFLQIGLRLEQQLLPRLSAWLKQRP